MGTRLGVRPRPLDAGKQLNIVRDENELDKEEVKDPLTEGSGLDKKHDEHAKKAKEIIDIPIPPVTVVPTYHTDYLPLHAIGLTYLRAPNKGDIDRELIEYDLDYGDEAFLREINEGGQDRLSDRRLEILLWRLETANAEATERGLAQSGATAAERSAPTTAACVDYLPKSLGMELMQSTCRCQEHILERVFDYWRHKRKTQQKPSLRRLQAPTPESDNNPFLVFRMRAKPNRPQTRRRRETQEESLEKLRTIRHNLEMTLRLASMVLVRERKKLELVNLNIDAQQFRLRSLCDRVPLDELEKKVVTALKTRTRAFDPRPLPKAGDRQTGPPMMDLAEFRQRFKRKRPRLDAVTTMPPPPMCAQPTMGFLYDLSHEEMREALDLSLLEDEVLRQKLRDGSVVARMGRGGRVCLDHLDAPMWEPLGGAVLQPGAGPGAGQRGGFEAAAGIGALANSGVDGDPGGFAGEPSTKAANGTHEDPPPDSQRARLVDRLAMCLLKV